MTFTGREGSTPSSGTNFLTISGVTLIARLPRGNPGYGRTGWDECQRDRYDCSSDEPVHHDAC